MVKNVTIPKVEQKKIHTLSSPLARQQNTNLIFIYITICTAMEHLKNYCRRIFGGNGNDWVIKRKNCVLGMVYGARGTVRKNDAHWLKSTNCTIQS